MTVSEEYQGESQAMSERYQMFDNSWLNSIKSRWTLSQKTALMIAQQGNNTFQDVGGHVFLSIIKTSN